MAVYEIARPAACWDSGRKECSEIRFVLIRCFLPWAQVKELVGSSLMALDRFSPDPELSQPAIAGITGSFQIKTPNLVWCDFAVQQPTEVSHTRTCYA